MLVISTQAYLHCHTDATDLQKNTACLMTQDDGPAKYNHAGLDKKNQNKLSDKTCSANHLTNIFAL